MADSRLKYCKEESWNIGDVIEKDITMSELGNACGPKEDYVTDGIISVKNRVKAWKNAGMTQKSCPYALIIASGEDSTGPSGLFVCDTCRGIAGNNIYQPQNWDPKTPATTGNRVPSAPGATKFGCFSETETKLTNDKQKPEICRICKKGESNCTTYSDCGKYGSKDCKLWSKGCGTTNDPAPYGNDCELNLRNPCVNAWASVRTLMFPSLIPNTDYTAYMPGCNSLGTSQTNISGDQRYNNTNRSNVGDCNYIGPFCHYQWQPSSIGGNPTQSTGPAWGGGQDSAWDMTRSPQLTTQFDGFPYYYYEKMLASMNEVTSTNIDANGRSIDLMYANDEDAKKGTPRLNPDDPDDVDKMKQGIMDRAIKLATELCDANWG